MVLGGYHPEGAAIIKQSREQGLSSTLVGFDALATDEFAKLGGSATNGVLMSFPPKAEDDPKNAALVKKFRDGKYNPEGYTLFSYAAVKAWAAGGQQGQVDRLRGTSRRRCVRQQYDSTVGPLVFDQKGDIKKPVYDIYIWKDGNYSPIKK